MTIVSTFVRLIQFSLLYKSIKNEQYKSCCNMWNLYKFHKPQTKNSFFILGTHKGTMKVKNLFQKIKMLILFLKSKFII